MRILGLSDIHGRSGVVRRLRTLERNVFDAVVVAGDIGGGVDGARDVMKVLATFECPVLYILGNHDPDLSYDMQLHVGCHHLHGQPSKVGGFTFAGFSGISGGWGRNPVASAASMEVERKHEATVARLAILDAEVREAAAALEKTHAERICALDVRIADRRSRAYAAAKDRLSGSRDRELRRILHPAEKAGTSREFKAYLADSQAVDAIVLAGNRADLARSVGETDPARVIVVTHERLPGTATDMYGVPLFLHGHRHGYANTRHRGSRFINVSALDNVVTMMPESCGEAHPGTMKHMRNADLGTYVVMEIDDRGRIDATSKPLWAPPAGWIPARRFKLRLPMLPQVGPSNDGAGPTDGIGLRAS